MAENRKSRHRGFAEPLLRAAPKPSPQNLFLTEDFAQQQSTLFFSENLTALPPLTFLGLFLSFFSNKIL